MNSLWNATRLSARNLLGNVPNFTRSTLLQYSGAAVWNSQAIKDAVTSNKVVVFMKGTPDQPMCGFSRAVVQILDIHGVNKFKSYNILEDEELRQQIKEYSNWPTVPQVYMNGEFVGGCDIMIEMHKSGDLIEELEGIGHRSALLDEEPNEQK